MVVTIGSTSQGCCHNKSVALEQCLIHGKHLVTMQYCVNSYYEIDSQGGFHPSPTFNWLPCAVSVFISWLPQVHSLIVLQEMLMGIVSSDP